MELRGNSRISRPDAGVGGFRAIDGRDIDLKYGPGGEAIEHALVVGNATIQLAGQAGGAGRRIAANTVDLSFAPDGLTPLAVTARDNVQLTFPADQEAALRTIDAQSLDGTGEAGIGLTRAHFAGAVRYTERGAGIDRRATSQALDVVLGPAMSSIKGRHVCARRPLR